MVRYAFMLKCFWLPCRCRVLEGLKVACVAVGAILYEMVVGYPPFFSDDAVTTCLKIVNWRKYLKYPEGVRPLLLRSSEIIHGVYLDYP